MTKHTAPAQPAADITPEFDRWLTLFDCTLAAEGVTDRGAFDPDDVLDEFVAGNDAVEAATSLTIAYQD